MKKLSFLANALWAASSLPGALLFERAASRVEETQRKLLRRYLRQNENTLFGREHGFSEISSFEDFREKVPLSSYENFLPYVERIGGGENDVLFPGKPIRFEPTSGSASATKNIPYNRALKKEFQAGLSPWIADLFKNLPASMRGRAYWSISPASIGEKFTEGGIPVGFEDDSEYLGPLARRLMGEVLAVPSLVSKLNDIEDVRYVTLLFLLAAEDLSLISIWNPTFLTLLLQPLGEWLPRISEDLARGKISLSLPEEIRGELEKSLGRHPRRARAIREIFEKKGDSPDLFESLWPNLALISCWTEASAYGPFSELKKNFPRVKIQSKGLLATEGIISFPLLHHGAALCLRSHFFEFLPSDGKNPLPAWEIKEGERYFLVMTTGGGLYRYQLGDLVEVTGF
ncbi:MAG TPA: GH3 auxin-responsive promoter family protein, partial [Chroococcales cyanobacterium]